MIGELEPGMLAGDKQDGGASPRSASAWATGLSLMASGRVPTTNAIRYWRSFPPSFGACHFSPNLAMASKSVRRKGLDKRAIRCASLVAPGRELQLAKRPSIDGMLVAQVTDLHIGFDRDNPHELNVRRLNLVIDQLNAMRPKPSMLLVTGDLVEWPDDVDAYRHMVALIGRWQGPVLWAIGNHDGRDAFRAVLPQRAGR